MSESSQAAKVLDRHFLEMRCKILDLAAALDRIDRAGAIAGDGRMGQIENALRLLTEPAADRAERVQLLFSDPYDNGWKRPR